MWRIVECGGLGSVEDWGLWRIVEDWRLWRIRECGGLESVEDWKVWRIGELTIKLFL